MEKLSNLKIIKKVLINLKDSIWRNKYYLTFLIGFFISLISILEPFFFIKIISKIEEFYKTWIFNFIDLIWYIIFKLRDKSWCREGHIE